MQRTGMIVCGAVVAVALASVADAQHRAQRMSASLSGDQEVPALSTPAAGEIRLEIDEPAQAVDYTLAYGGLLGTVTQAHIHFAQPDVNGGIMVWLCGTETNPGPANTPVCPQSGTVTGTIRAMDVVGPSGQGISPGEFEEFLAALRNGLGYANVHSTMWPGGEIRGQIRQGAGR